MEINKATLYVLCFISFRFTLLPSLSLATPLRRSGTATSPLTRFWGRPTSVSERTEVSASSVSRYLNQVYHGCLYTRKPLSYLEGIFIQLNRYRKVGKDELGRII